MAKVSIIVPIYNKEKYLPKCIESLQNQTLEDIEIVLVNDGSVDNCGDIADLYASKDKRIKVLHKENGGPSSARNAGLDIADGEYIGFTDGDDWVSTDMYKELYELIIEKGADISVCDFIRVNNDEQARNTSTSNEISCLSNIQALHSQFSIDLCGQMCILCNKLYKRELFEGIRFPVGKIHEDEFTLYKLLYKVNILVMTKKVLYYYRDTPNSIMNSKFNINRLAGLEAFKERAIFFKDAGIEDLYYKAIHGYGLLLIDNYFKARINIDDHKKYLQHIKNEYDSICGHLLSKNCRCNIYRKLGFCIFKFNPDLWKVADNLYSSFHKNANLENIDDRYKYLVLIQEQAKGKK